MSLTRFYRRLVINFLLKPFFGPSVKPATSKYWAVNPTHPHIPKCLFCSVDIPSVAPGSITSGFLASWASLTH